jgi:hypothetical protein
MSLLLAIGQKYALASDGVKAQLLHESKTTSLHTITACGGRFRPPFFEVKISRQSRSCWKKTGKKNWLCKVGNFPDRKNTFLHVFLRLSSSVYKNGVLGRRAKEYLPTYMIH